MLSVSGEEQPAIKLDDISVYIDSVNSKVVMKKEGFDPILFDLKEKMVICHGFRFDMGGEIRGITDTVDLENPRGDFTVSEKGISIFMSKLDVIIELLNILQNAVTSLSSKLTNVETNILSTMYTYQQNLEDHLVSISSDLADGFETVEGALTAMTLDLDSRFAGVMTYVINSAGELATFHSETGTELTALKQDVAAIKERIPVIETDLATIQDMIQELLDR
jgi:hypothetical protein